MKNIIKKILINNIINMNTEILVPIELAEYLGFDNEDDMSIDLDGERYKYIDLDLFIEHGLGIDVETNATDLFFNNN